MKTRKSLFLGLGLVLLAGLFAVFRPESPPPDAIPAAPAAPPAVPEFAFSVAGGQRVSGPAVMAVVQGDTVRVLVQADRDDELHLHGYELSRGIKAGEPARLEFTAGRSGRFELELHRSHLDLAVLEVRPK